MQVFLGRENSTAVISTPDNLGDNIFWTEKIFSAINNSEIISPQKLHEMYQAEQRNIQERPHLIAHLFETEGLLSRNIINLPITEIIQLSTHSYVPMPGSFPCLFYPYCNATFSTIEECLIHTYLQETEAHQELLKFKRFLPHELTLYISLLPRFQYQIPNLIDNFLPFEVNTRNNGFVIRKCPLPNCTHMIIDPEDFRGHFADHFAHSNKLSQSVNLNGFIWTIVISYVKIIGRIPTLREFLGIPNSYEIIPRTPTNLKFPIPIIILIRNLDYSFDNAPPWMAIQQGNSPISIPGIPSRFEDGGVILNYQQIRNPHTMQQIPMNNDIRVEEIFNEEDMKNIEISTTTPIIEESNETNNKAIQFKEQKINDIKIKLFNLILRMIETRYQQMNLTNNTNQTEEFHNVKINPQQIKVNMDVPEFMMNKSIVPINIPETKVILYNQEIAIPKFTTSQKEVLLETPKYKIVPKEVEYPVETPKCKIIPKDIEYPLDVPHYKPRPTEVELKVPEYNIIKKEECIPIPAPKFTINRKEINMDVDIVKYDYRDKVIPVDVPKVRLIPKNVDVPLPIPNFIFYNNQNQTPQTTNNNNNNSNGNVNGNGNQNTSNTSNQEPNGNRENRGNEERNDKHMPEELIEELKQVNSDEDLRNLIYKWNSYNITNIDDWIKDDKPLENHYITNLMVVNGKWPGVNTFVCPYACGFASHSNTTMDIHQNESHGKTLNGNPILETAASIINRSSFWKIIVSGNNQRKRKEYRNTLWCCPCPNCDYVGEGKSTFASHIRKLHPQMNKDKNIYGWFWAAILQWIKNPLKGKPPTLAKLFRPRKGKECNYCRTIGTSLNNVSLHAKAMHGTSRVEGNQGHFEDAMMKSYINKLLAPEKMNQIRSKAEENEQEIKEIRKRIKENEFNPINETNNNNEPPQQQNVEINENENAIRNRRLEDEERQRRRDQRMIQRVENHVTIEQQNNINNIPQPDNIRSQEDQQITNEILNEIIEATRPITDLENADELLEKARKWIKKCELEELKGINLPRCDSRMRKALHKPIFDLMKDKILPLFEKLKMEKGYIINDQKWYILEGIIAKTIYSLRKTIRTTLKIPLSRMTRRQPILNRNNGNDQENERLTFRRENNLNNLVAHLEKYLELREKERNQSRENAITVIENKIVNTLQNLDDDIINRTFGERNIQAIRSFAEEEAEFRNLKLNWLKNTIENEISTRNGNVSKAYQDKIQKLYQEDPRRCLNWHICKNPTPECPLNITQFENFFKDEWDSKINFQTPNLNSKWNLTKCFEEEDKNYFTQLLLDKDKIKEAIRSRPNLSAHGNDGISNAIWKINNKATMKIIRIIISYMIVYERIPDRWKSSKTVLLYKKGNPEEVRAWRPISISDTLYRIIFCHFSKCIQIMNNRISIISNAQKGFKEGINGAAEHIETLNELISNARRKKQSIYITALDFTNAFGTVPHELITWVLKAKGFPDRFVNIIKYAYKNSYTKINYKGRNSNPIFVRRGVKQGCPLSPTLFNLCLEPLINAIQTINKDDGILVEDETNNEILRFNIQAYADDVVLMSSSEVGMKNMLRTVEKFCKFAGMELSPKKCKTLCYTYSNRTRNSISTDFKINNEIIPQISLFSFIEYLGIPIGCNRATKKHHSRLLINEIKKEISEIMNSPLKITQKIDCIKRMITPKFDYVMLNSVCPPNDLKELDSFIRGWIDKLCNTKCIPIDYFYTSWKDGGLGIKNLHERYLILTIRNFIAMKYSKDLSVRKLTNQLEKDERDYRGLITDEGSPYMNIRFDENKRLIQTRRNKENCLFIRAIKSIAKLGLILVIDEDQKIRLGDFDQRVCEQDVEVEDLLEQLNLLICARHRSALKNLDFKGHTFHTLEKSKISNYFFTQCKFPVSDAIAKFTILSRTNNLSTGEILHKNSPDKYDGKCHRCRSNQNDSLMHRLNGCQSVKSWYKPRHDAILKEIIKGIRENDKENKLSINFDKPIKKDNTRLPERSARAKPDAWFFVNNELTIIEVNSPYGKLIDTEEGRKNSLIVRRQEKIDKYANLVEDCNTTFGCNTKLYVIVVSSLGAVPKDTYNDIKAILHNDKYKAKIIAKRCSLVALRESLRVYRRWANYNLRHNARDQEEEEQIREEIRRTGDTDDEEEEGTTEERINNISDEEDFDQLVQDSDTNEVESDMNEPHGNRTSNTLDNQASL